MRFCSCFIAVLALITAFTLFSHADTVTYDYTGKTLGNGSAVVGNITLNTPLGDNLKGVEIDPATFSFTDGAVIITNYTNGLFTDEDFSRSRQTRRDRLSTGLSRLGPPLPRSSSSAAQHIAGMMYSFDYIL
jgi:hypothetical protein